MLHISTSGGETKDNKEIEVKKTKAEEKKKKTLRKQPTRDSAGEPVFEEEYCFLCTLLSQNDASQSESESVLLSSDKSRKF
ncbi:hypothetical protein CDAR_81371 [Caerostris darwini]|uniref:Uncharacterized protein n=1 Tax=Caerostris darwini TaxID=1538125 RepID=A0AAV4M621_9ARAC|nr:hypothetical protein CDAR_81371 [Caerostris darwini]